MNVENKMVDNNNSINQNKIAKKKNDVKIPENIIKNMDDNNKEVAKIWNNEGVESAVKFMTKEMCEGNMTYSEMREKYG
jgi:hypothetical protein